MIAKRIIPCLDLHNGRVVKGINFVNLTDAGDPIECALEYNRQGADEIVFLNISATNEGKNNIIDIVRKAVENVFVPITVGGGITTIEDIVNLINAGADKVSINSAAVKNPQLLSQAADKFGSQCIVLAADVKHIGGGRYNIFINGGKTDSGLDALEWIEKAVKLGAGEVLLTSMDADGTKAGYDLNITDLVSNAVNVPVIASGGGGSLNDFYEVFTKANADAALAASLFHFGELKIGDVKAYLNNKGIAVRL